MNNKIAKEILNKEIEKWEIKETQNDTTIYNIYNILSILYNIRENITHAEYEEKMTPCRSTEGQKGRK